MQNSTITGSGNVINMNDSNFDVVGDNIINSYRALTLNSYSNINQSLYSKHIATTNEDSQFKVVRSDVLYNELNALHDNLTVNTLNVSDTVTTKDLIVNDIVATKDLIVTDTVHNDLNVDGRINSKNPCYYITALDDNITIPINTGTINLIDLMKNALYYTEDGKYITNVNNELVIESTGYYQVTVSVILGINNDDIFNIGWVGENASHWNELYVYTTYPRPIISYTTIIKKTGISLPIYPVIEASSFNTNKLTNLKLTVVKISDL